MPAVFKLRRDDLEQAASIASLEDMKSCFDRVVFAARTDRDASGLSDEWIRLDGNSTLIRCAELVGVSVPAPAVVNSRDGRGRAAVLEGDLNGGLRS